MTVPRPMKALGFLMVCAAAIGTTRWTQPQPLDDWRTRFTEAALKIPFDKDLPPQRDTMEAPSARVPEMLLRMRIAVARSRDSGQTAHIDFRITSDSAYPRLGIAPGLNYVWKDFVNGRMRLLLIPADTSYMAHWLVVQAHNHPPPIRVPRLVIARPLRTAAKADTSQRRIFALEVCTDECRDPMSWCNARDTMPSTQFKTPLASFQRYFARNHVAWARR
jgi:hypothetical protein